MSHSRIGRYGLPYLAGDCRHDGLLDDCCAIVGLTQCENETCDMCEVRCVGKDCPNVYCEVHAAKLSEERLCEDCQTAVNSEREELAERIEV